MSHRGRRLLWSTAIVVLAASVLYCCATMTQMPGQSHRGPLPEPTGGTRALARRLEAHVRKLAHEIGARHIGQLTALRRAEAYIKQTWETQGYKVERQPYQVSGQTVANLWVELRGAKEPDRVIVVGAHYDTVPTTPGANDNGSGVAALLELSARYAGSSPAKTLRFVAFVNEEPPYFQTEQMGSLVYARSCQARGDQVEAMLALETMGYYSDVAGSQKYPFPFSAFYPDTGNFIGVIGNTSSRALVRRVARQFRDQVRFPCEGAAIPGFIPGIGWSDHWSFWQVGYPAVMITDTAPFRFPHYHKQADTADTLDYERLARVVAGLGSSVVGQLVGGVEGPPAEE
jgi:hypothetical protein